MCYGPHIGPMEVDGHGAHVLGILPLLAVFLLLQRQIAQGVASTGIK
jgi:ABC-type maltose transport system permease subunit